MKALLLRRDGFRKEIDADEEKPYLCFYTLGRVYHMSQLDEDVKLNEIMYYLDRKFTNEYNEDILIYREVT